MFRGIENILRKTDGKPTDPDLLPVRSASELIGNEKNQEKIAQLPKLVGLPQEKYLELGKPFFEDFIEFVQELPETRSGYFSLKGGIFSHCLARTVNALEMLHAYFLVEGDEKLSEAQTLWSYAIFTAGLLQGIGKVIVDLKVEIYDGYQQHIGHWVPFEGSMVDSAKYYRYSFDSAWPDTFRNQATLLLARQLLPDAGFAWLASNKELFSVWLSLLDDDDSHGTRTLNYVLWRADALALNDFFDANPNLRDLVTAADYGREKRSGSSFIHDTAPHGNAGLAFLSWVRDQINSRRFPLDTGPVIAVPGGVLVTSEAFEIFTRESNVYKNWQYVQTQFTGLGIHRLGSNNEIFQRYSRIHDRTPLRGMLITNRFMLMNDDIAKQATGHGYVKMPSEQASSSQQYINKNGMLTNQAPTTQTPGPSNPSMKSK